MEDGIDIYFKTIYSRFLRLPIFSSANKVDKYPNTIPDDRCQALKPKNVQPITMERKRLKHYKIK